MCLLRPCRDATFRCIMVRVRVGIRLHVGVVHMRSLSGEMLRRPKIGERVRNDLLLILFTICEVCLFVSIVLAHQGKKYRSAIYGVTSLVCSVPFLRAWGMRD